MKYPVLNHHNLETTGKPHRYNNIDIVVGDKRYMTQINDWFSELAIAQRQKPSSSKAISFPSTATTSWWNKRPHPFHRHRRLLDFEFTSTANFTGYEDGVTWIKVYGKSSVKPLSI
ncbi:MAG: hypothetical protein ACLUIQ_07535 [Dialister invisus]